MRRPTRSLVVLLLVACASGAPPIAKPEIEFVQLYAPTDLGYARGQNTIMAQFGFRVLNRATEPITLRRVQLESIGEGGYYLRREDKSFTRQIGVGEAVQDTIDARAYFNTTMSGSASTEPVTVRATFYFDSAAGSFRQIVLRNIGQFHDGPR